VQGLWTTDRPVYSGPGVELGRLVTDGYLRRRDPWNSRAWALEEQLLSPRLLLYIYDGLKWLCKDRAFASGADEALPPPEQFFALPWNRTHHSHGLKSTELREL
jgi:hypothetical protein